MSTEVHNSGHRNGEPFNDSVTFEPRDINVATVVKQLIYLAITIVLSLLLCIPILRVLTTRAADSDTPMAPVRADMSQTERQEQSLPPEPRLQGVPGHQADAQQDLRDKIAADMEANESSGWVDKANGIAKIPVTEAMKIIAEKAGTVSAQQKSAQEKKK
jgi:hypothetical protein